MADSSSSFSSSDAHRRHLHPADDDGDAGGVGMGTGGSADDDDDSSSYHPYTPAAAPAGTVDPGTSEHSPSLAMSTASPRDDHSVAVTSTAATAGSLPSSSSSLTTWSEMGGTGTGSTKNSNSKLPAKPGEGGAGDERISSGGVAGHDNDHDDDANDDMMVERAVKFLGDGRIEDLPLSARLNYVRRRMGRGGGKTGGGRGGGGAPTEGQLRKAVEIYLGDNSGVDASVTGKEAPKDWVTSVAATAAAAHEHVGASEAVADIDGDRPETKVGSKVVRSAARSPVRPHDGDDEDDEDEDEDEADGEYEEDEYDDGEGEDWDKTNRTYQNHLDRNALSAPWPYAYMQPPMAPTPPRWPGWGYNNLPPPQHQHQPHMYPHWPHQHPSHGRLHPPYPYQPYRPYLNHQPTLPAPTPSAYHEGGYGHGHQQGYEHGHGHEQGYNLGKDDGHGHAHISEPRGRRRRRAHLGDHTPPAADVGSSPDDDHRDVDGDGNLAGSAGLGGGGAPSVPRASSDDRGFDETHGHHHPDHHETDGSAAEAGMADVGVVPAPSAGLATLAAAGVVGGWAGAVAMASWRWINGGDFELCPPPEIRETSSSASLATAPPGATTVVGRRDAEVGTTTDEVEGDVEDDRGVTAAVDGGMASANHGSDEEEEDDDDDDYEYQGDDGALLVKGTTDERSADHAAHHRHASASASAATAADALTSDVLRELTEAIRELGAVHTRAVEAGEAKARRKEGEQVTDSVMSILRESGSRRGSGSGSGGGGSSSTTTSKPTARGKGGVGVGGGAVVVDPTSLVMPMAEIRAELGAIRQIMILREERERERGDGRDDGHDGESSKTSSSLGGRIEEAVRAVSRIEGRLLGMDDGNGDGDGGAATVRTTTKSTTADRRNGEDDLDGNVMGDEATPSSGSALDECPAADRQPISMSTPKSSILAENNATDVIDFGGAGEKEMDSKILGGPILPNGPVPHGSVDDEIAQAVSDLVPAVDDTLVSDALRDLVARNSGQEDDDATLVSGVQMLHMYISNLARNPSVPRYRRIHMLNPNYTKKVAPLVGAKEFLCTVGFVERPSANLLEWRGDDDGDDTEDSSSASKSSRWDEGTRPVGVESASSSSSAVDTLRQTSRLLGEMLRNGLPPNAAADKRASAATATLPAAGAMQKTGDSNATSF